MVVNTMSMMGPGVLTIGAAGAGQLIAQSQVRACSIEPTENVTRTEEKPVLSGEKLAASESASYTWALRATFLQDKTTLGVMDYTFTNAGVTKPFTFQPANAGAAKVTGNLRVMPIKFGGDVNDPSPESEVTMQIIGTPVWTHD